MKNILIESVIFISILLFAYLLYIFLKDKTEKIKRVPFIVITVILLAMEAAKQIYSFIVGYNLYYIPLQICSLFLLCYPLAVFARGRVRDYGWCMSLCLGSSLCLAQLFLSQILTQDYIFKLFTAQATPFHYHTVFYHHIIVLHFVLMLFLKPYKPKKQDILPTLVMYSVFMVISCVFANLLHTNYSGYINYGAAVFDYFKRYGQAVFNIVGFCLNTLEYLLGVFICFFIYNKLITKKQMSDKSSK